MRTPDESGSWSVPIGHVWGVRLSLSYGVFIAAGILVAILLTNYGDPGTADLPKVFVIGSAFWLAGWAGQAFAYLGLCWFLRSPETQLSLGLVGVETRVRRWSASRALVVTLGTIVSLIVLGSFFRLIEGGFQVPTVSSSPAGNWVAPDFGRHSSDSVWRIGAWLCWVQAIFQMYPLPRTLGRQLIGAMTGLCGSRLRVESQTLVFRRCLAIIVMIAFAFSAVLFWKGTSNVIPAWPLLIVIGVLLWLSIRSPDVEMMLEGQMVYLDDEAEPSLTAVVRDRFRMWLGQRRIQKAFDKERGEAADASRLDDVLNRLHRDGLHSLNEDDKSLLQRVSENLRSEREA